VARAEHSPPWGDTEELLAAAVDRLGEVAYLLRKAHFKGDPQPPAPVPRPGDGGQPTVVELAEPPRMSSKEEIRAFFGQSIRYSES
jgi:hypothetical protein